MCRICNYPDTTELARETRKCGMTGDALIVNCGNTTVWNTDQNNNANIILIVFHIFRHIEFSQNPKVCIVATATMQTRFH